MKKLLLFACAAFLVSCSSDDDSSNNDDNNNTSGVAYVRGKMDNVDFDYTFNNTVDDTFLYNATSGYSGEGFDRWYYYGGVLTTFNPPTLSPEFFISWNHLYFGQGGDEAGETAAFYDTVSDLPTNWLTEAQDEAHTPGLEVAFEAADGTFYTSKGGSQSGSALAVTNSTQGTVNGLKTMTVTGTFSCKLYNTDDPTDVIDVTNGKYKLILSEFQ
ncbi:MAG TPA: hypothetical protein VF676_02950 [Flavobacterium sp.]|jgi:hypothetical protein